MESFELNSGASTKLGYPHRTGGAVIWRLVSIGVASSSRCVLRSEFPRGSLNEIWRQ